MIIIFGLKLRYHLFSQLGKLEIECFDLVIGIQRRLA